MSREQEVERQISGAPPSAQNLLSRAFSGSASPREAIKATCLACVGFNRSAVKKCTGWTCPLWVYRPFQDET